MTRVRQVNEGFENFVESFEKKCNLSNIRKKGFNHWTPFYWKCSCESDRDFIFSRTTFFNQSSSKFSGKGPLLVKHHYFCFCMSTWNCMTYSPQCTADSSLLCPACGDGFLIFPSTDVNSNLLLAVPNHTRQQCLNVSGILSITRKVSKKSFGDLKHKRLQIM